MKKTPTLFVIAILCGLLLIFGSASSTPTMVNLGTLGGIYSVASGINNQGQIVGEVGLPMGVFMRFFGRKE